MKKWMIIIAALILITVAIIAGMDATGEEERISFADTGSKMIQQEKSPDKAEDMVMRDEKASEADLSQKDRSAAEEEGEKASGHSSHDQSAVSGSGQTASRPGSNIKEAPSKHTHNWEAVYGERLAKKERQIPWTKCYCCGEDMTGDPKHIDKHLLDHESNVHYGTEYRLEVYYETESYISGYECPCGAVK